MSGEEAAYLCVMQSPPTWEALAARVKDLASKGFGQQKVLASKLGVAEGRLSNWLSGRRVPRLNEALKLIDEIDGSWDELLGKTRPEAPIDEANPIWLPLVGEGVAAGPGSLPQDTEGTSYAFRPSWKALRGHARDKDRFCLVKLGDESVADSMEPDIPAKSILLLDRGLGVRVSPAAGRPYLCLVDRKTEELALKDVFPTIVRGEIRSLVLSSRNRKYPPRVIELAPDEPVQDIVKAKLVWHGTEW